MNAETDQSAAGGDTRDSGPQTPDFEVCHELLASAGSPPICVVGDMMLDTYVWGEVSRVSPEGPIPVLRVQRRDRRPGGAGSVAAMLAGLGAEALAVGVVGDDEAALALRRELESAGVDSAGLVASAERPTTTKTRYLGYVQSAGRALQQMLRVDEELTDHLSQQDADAVRRSAHQRIQQARLVIIQDMGKGVLDDELIRDLIQEADTAGKPVIVDPERAEDYGRYAGAACVLPNRYEAQMATGLMLRSEEDYARAADGLIEELSLEAALIKLDREGLYYATATGRRGHITTQAREVADVTGAGDMVTAAFSLALAAGADHATAATLANFAAGLEVTQRGATALPRDRVLDALRSASDPVSRKIVPRARVADLVAELRESGLRIAFTNGCFDLVHLGHLQLIHHARERGDVLIVGLNSDKSARELKGPGRPVNSEQVRGRILASLGDVDYVVVFEEQSVLPLLKEVRPDVLVKGGDYTKEGVVGHEFVESYGGEVALAPLAEGYSTTDLIRRIADNHEGQD